MNYTVNRRPIRLIDVAKNQKSTLACALSLSLSIIIRFCVLDNNNDKVQNFSAHCARRQYDPKNKLLLFASESFIGR